MGEEGGGVCRGPRGALDWVKKEERERCGPRERLSKEEETMCVKEIVTRLMLI